ncbi:MAG: SpaA isopeptide-forming pilin-related protein, partial [Firmicutes bacterium]|nr:SpaA isopeptide-forming pilin-related protein [Bacillota bacterium]
MRGLKKRLFPALLSVVMILAMLPLGGIASAATPVNLVEWIIAAGSTADNVSTGLNSVAASGGLYQSSGEITALKGGNTVAPATGNSAFATAHQTSASNTAAGAASPNGTFYANGSVSGGLWAPPNANRDLASAVQFAFQSTGYENLQISFWIYASSSTAPAKFDVMASTAMSGFASLSPAFGINLSSPSAITNTTAQFITVSLPATLADQANAYVRLVQTDTATTGTIRFGDVIVTGTPIVTEAVTPPTPGAGAGSITLVPAAGSTLDMTGLSFSAYQLFDADGVLNSDFAGFTYPAGSVTDAASQLFAYLQSLAPGSPELNAAAAALADYASTNGITAAQAVGTAGSAVFSDLPFGYYLVTGDVGGVPSNILSLLPDSAGTADLTVELKSDAPTLIKQVLNDNTGALDTWTDAAIGGTVQFALTTNVPALPGYDYTVTDTPCAGLAIDPASVAVTVGPSPGTALAATDFSATAGAGGVLVITMNHSVLDTLTAGDPIVITYSATLNPVADGTVIGGAGNPNSAVLSYAVGGETGSTPAQVATVYTYEINILKTEEDGTTGLAGATFELQDKDTNVIDTFTSDKTVYAISGLDQGTYYLVETAAPKGYDPLPDPVEIVIGNVAVDPVTHVVTYDVSVNGAAADPIVVINEPSA